MGRGVWVEGGVGRVKCRLGEGYCDGGVAEEAVRSGGWGEVGVVVPVVRPVTDVNFFSGEDGTSWIEKDGFPIGAE